MKPISHSLRIVTLVCVRVRAAPGGSLQEYNQTRDSDSTQQSQVGIGGHAEL